MTNNSNNSTLNNDNSKVQKRRGRPPKDNIDKREKKLNITMRHSVFIKLTRLTAEKQLETGIRMSVNKIINNVFEEHIKNSSIKENVN